MFRQAIFWFLLHHMIWCDLDILLTQQFLILKQHKTLIANTVGSLITHKAKCYLLPEALYGMKSAVCCNYTAILEPLLTLTHTIFSFLHSEITLLCGCHSNTKANNSPKPFLKSRKPGMKIATIKFAHQCIDFHHDHYITPRTCTHSLSLLCLSPSSTQHRRRQHYKSIYKLWEASGWEWKWTMADEGYWKTFSFRHTERV